MDADGDAELEDLADVDVDAEVDADLSAILDNFLANCDCLFGGLCD